MPYFFDRVRETTVTTGSGSLTLAGAVTNFRTFNSVLATGNTTIYVIEDTVNNAWEVGLGTYSGSNILARTTLLSSSTGSFLTLAAGTKFVYIDVPASMLFQTSNNVTDLRYFAPTNLAGGRLALTSGTAVTTSDVTGATNVYYTPYENSLIGLYDANIAKAVLVPFTQTTLALGTLTSGKNYDVFGYLSSGALALTTTAWTNDTTRATALQYDSIQGYLVSSGNSAQRYLGTFRTTATTTTEDSKAKRFLWNMYNRVPREIRNYESTTAWSYGTSTWRAINNLTTNQVAFLIGLNESPVSVRATSSATSSVGNTAAVGLNLDATTGAPPTPYVGQIGGGGYSFFAQSLTIDYSDYPGLGYHYLQMMEYGGGTNTFYGGGNGGGIISGTIEN